MIVKLHVSRTRHESEVTCLKDTNVNLTVLGTQWKGEVICFKDTTGYLFWRTLMWIFTRFKGHSQNAKLFQGHSWTMKSLVSRTQQDCEGTCFKDTTAGVWNYLFKGGSVGRLLYPAVFHQLFVVRHHVCWWGCLRSTTIFHYFLNLSKQDYKQHSHFVFLLFFSFFQFWTFFCFFGGGYLLLYNYNGNKEDF